MVKCLRYSFLVLSFTVFILGALDMVFNTMLIGLLFLFSANIIYSFENIKRRIFFLFFHLVIFVFLLSRPVISMAKGNVWWYFEVKSLYFALTSLLLTMICLLIGSIFAETLLARKRRTPPQKIVSRDQIIARQERQEFINALRMISLLLFYTAMIFFMIKELEKLLFMRGKEYEQFYTLFKSSLPYPFRVIADMMPYFLCVFLSTMPKKNMAFLPLALYLFSALPSLLIGMRNPIALNFIFVFLYYFIRDVLEDTKKWLGFTEKLLLIIMAPLGLIFLGAYNYIRAGTNAKSDNPISLIIDFFYKQGVSFDVLCIGHDAIPKIADTGFTNYTFGGFLDYLGHGTFAQVLFGAKSLGDGNNLNAALYSNSFAHRMSYVTRGQEYLEGHGWGSSYLLETFADFGYPGIIIFSILLGILFIYFLPMVRKNWFLGTLVLMSLTSIFFTPRAEATGWLTFIITVQFIAAVVLCYIVSKLMIKKYSYHRALSHFSRHTILPKKVANYYH